MHTAVEWTRADEQLPPDGASLAAAVTGRYPVKPEDDGDPLSGKEFWLVLPMHFRHLHLVEETGETMENCFYDSDGVIRFPAGGPRSDEVVTHWAELPNLPGLDVRRVMGDEVQPALRAARDV